MPHFTKFPRRHAQDPPLSYFTPLSLIRCVLQAHSADFVTNLQNVHINWLLIDDRSAHTSDNRLWTSSQLPSLGTTYLYFCTAVSYLWYTICFSFDREVLLHLTGRELENIDATPKFYISIAIHFSIGVQTVYEVLHIALYQNTITTRKFSHYGCFNRLTIFLQPTKQTTNQYYTVWSFVVVVVVIIILVYLVGLCYIRIFSYIAYKL